MALGGLIEAYPWPEQRPEAPAVSWGWGIEGQELLRCLVKPEVAVVLEIGSLLGGSARFWADHCPSAHVICVDPWTDVANVADRPFLEHVPDLVDFVVGRTDGLFDVFVASNWELRHRITPLRGFSPDALTRVLEHQVRPDVVYVDGSHVYEDVIADVASARTLFPSALICGDDYNWPAVGAAIDYLVASRGDVLHTEGNTWAIEYAGAGRHAARSARTIGPVERSWPVRTALRFRQRS
ncbi:MAG: class I SAM-dependent methyltransferase [Actinomycetota bacterium]